MYTERTEQFFIANGITNDAKKVTILLTVIGGKAYALLRNPLAPAKPAEKSFDILVKDMKDHLKPKPLVITERFKFHRRNQHEGETVTQYLAKLRKFSEQCDFKEYLKEALRDRPVCELRSEVIQRRLPAKENLTLKKAQELALGMETAAKTFVSCKVRDVQQNCSCRETCAEFSVRSRMIVTGVENKTTSPPVPIQDHQVSQLHCKNKFAMLANYLVTTVEWLSFLRYFKECSACKTFSGS